MACDVSRETLADLDQRDRFLELTFKPGEWKWVDLGPANLRVIKGPRPATPAEIAYFSTPAELSAALAECEQAGGGDDIMSVVRAVARGG